jgi:hypothetical protein
VVGEDGGLGLRLDVGCGPGVRVFVWGVFLFLPKAVFTLSSICKYRIIWYNSRSGLIKNEIFADRIRFCVRFSGCDIIGGRRHPSQPETLVYCGK